MCALHHEKFRFLVLLIRSLYTSHIKEMQIHLTPRGWALLSKLRFTQACQNKMAHILWNTTVHYCAYVRHGGGSLSWVKWIQFTASHSEINLNIILPSTFRYSVWSLSFGVFDQKFVCVSIVSHASHFIVLWLIVINSKYWLHTQYLPIRFCHYFMPQPNMEHVLLLCRDSFYKIEVRFPAQT